MAELADASLLKSEGHSPYQFESDYPHTKPKEIEGSSPSSGTRR